MTRRLSSRSHRAGRRKLALAVLLLGLALAHLGLSSPGRLVQADGATPTPTPASQGNGNGTGGGG